MGPAFGEVYTRLVRDDVPFESKIRRHKLRSLSPVGPREAIGSPAAFVAGWLGARSLSVLLYIVIGLISNDELRLSDVGGNLLQRRIRRGLGCDTCDVCYFGICLLEGSMGM